MVIEGGPHVKSFVHLARPRCATRERLRQTASRSAFGFRAEALEIGADERELAFETRYSVAQERNRSFVLSHT
jgi:hypothetical protein